MVEDGIGRTRRARRFHKATAGLQRLLIVGRSGYQTFEAARWLADASINVIHLDTDGRILSVSAQGPDKPALRRAQAWASTNHVGIEIIRHLLTLKIEGQADNCRRLDAANPEEMKRSLGLVQQAGDLEGLRIGEVQAAVAYWHAWTEVPIRFTRADQDRVPDHWLRLGLRRSPQSGSARRATSPINAVLNYLYALLEAEARIATIAVGLDPGLGILHLDKRARDSFALDLLESARPAVDNYVLDLLEGHRFRAADFQETRTGGCRIARPLAHRLSETSQIWRECLAAPAEEVAALLGRTPGINAGNPTTPLTQTNRRRVNGSTWAYPKSGIRPQANCESCGQPVLDSGRLCLPCRVEFQASGDWHQAGRREIAAMRAGGNDPAHGGEAARRRARSISRQNLASAAWSRENPARPRVEVFVEQIFPTLQSVGLREMADATGLSMDYCSKIRRGLKVPHPRHWMQLALLADPNPRGTELTSEAQ
jgi:CRISPR-associated protein Cas1